VVDGVICFACGLPRAAAFADGYEARSAGEGRGWLCGTCARCGELSWRFIAIMRARHRSIAFFRAGRSPVDHPLRLVICLPRTT
jgi:hypothetical protein